ncbi:MAG: GNAT family protein [Chloroflexota bacterium]
MSNINQFGQPIGFPLDDWTPCPPPSRVPMTGTYCTVEPLSVTKHRADLANVFVHNSMDSDWTYLPYGPYKKKVPYSAWLASIEPSEDPLFHAIIDNDTHEAVGIASYLRIEPAVGVIEVGHIHFSLRLQKTPAATEAMFLMMRRVFDDLGYRRYEWKCDALNAPSRAAAQRLGFTFEGIFRQATMYKGRNRDTAWFSILDSEWPQLKNRFEQWLSADNFDTDGYQKVRLQDL